MRGMQAIRMRGHRLIAAQACNARFILGTSQTPTPGRKPHLTWGSQEGETRGWRGHGIKELQSRGRDPISPAGQLPCTHLVCVRLLGRGSPAAGEGRVSRIIGRTSASAVAVRPMLRTCVC